MRLSKWEALLSANGFHMPSRRSRFGIVGVVAFIGAYIASIVLYVNSGMGQPHEVAENSLSGDTTVVTVDIEDIQSDNSVLRANLTVSPAPALLDRRSVGDGCPATPGSVGCGFRQRVMRPVVLGAPTHRCGGSVLASSAPPSAARSSARFAAQLRGKK